MSSVNIAIAIPVFKSDGPKTGLENIYGGTIITSSVL